MRARTHPGAEKHVETSSSQETMDSEKLEQKNADARGEANQELKESGLTVEDVASQSGYSQDEADLTQQAADSNKNKAG
jgi:hypothetical protein